MSAPAAAAGPPRISEEQKIAILRDLVAVVGIARMPMPMGKHGVELSAHGAVLNADTVRTDRQEKGDAARVGDRVAVTGIEFKDDRIVLALNGGPPKGHWYDHVQIGLGGAEPQPADPAMRQNQAQGTLLTLRFDSAVPPLTPAALRTLLNPAIDWDPPSKAEEMVKALPPSVKAAIEAHHVLVGMDRDMVVAAIGRPPKIDREDDERGQPYVEWMYNLPDPNQPGAPPPGPTTYVRFVDDRVSRVTVFGSKGEETVDVTPDPALAQRNQAAAAAKKEAEASETDTPAQRPTLRRAGDTSGDGADSNFPPGPPAPIQLPGAGPPGGGGGMPGGCCQLQLSAAGNAFAAATDESSRPAFAGRRVPAARA